MRQAPFIIFCILYGILLVVIIILLSIYYFRDKKVRTTFNIFNFNEQRQSLEGGPVQYKFVDNFIKKLKEKDNRARMSSVYTHPIRTPS